MTTDNEFCKIYTAITGEEITTEKQLVSATYSGEELREFVNDFIKELYEQRAVMNLERIHPNRAIDIYEDGILTKKTTHRGAADDLMRNEGDQIAEAYEQSIRRYGAFSTAHKSFILL